MNFTKWVLKFVSLIHSKQGQLKSSAIYLFQILLKWSSSFPLHTLITILTTLFWHPSLYQVTE